MPERNGYVPGVPCWVDLSCPKPKVALDFYGGLFGWEFEEAAHRSDGKYSIARHQAPSSSIFDLSGDAKAGDVAAIGSSAATSPARWNTYFWVDSADETSSKVLSSGGTVVSAPFAFMDAARVAVFKDPEGAEFRVWEAKGHKGARLVNDPGAVVFNGLNTRDPKGAKSFYGSVFGWQTGTIGGGAEGWTLPGYGDWLEAEHHPHLRGEMAEAGAPEGFEDVVGSIIPIPDEQPDTPAHWSVTFAVDDADGTASKALELGGVVIVPPFDAPWSTSGYTIRIALVADPQGATFGASKFISKHNKPGSP